jgi:hypothetical protein
MVRTWKAQDAMLDLAKAIHEAIGIESPRAFIAVFALVGLFLFAGLGWIVDKGYRVRLREQFAASPIQLSGIMRADVPILLPDDIDIDYLTGLYRGRTSIQGDKLAADYIGKRLKISSTVRDVVREGEDSTIVMVGPNIVRAYTPDAVLTFSKAWSPRVSLLKAGSPIAAVGTIDRIGASSVFLKDCELR